MQEIELNLSFHSNIVEVVDVIKFNQSELKWFYWTMI